MLKPLSGDDAQVLQVRGILKKQKRLNDLCYIFFYSLDFSFSRISLVYVFVKSVVCCEHVQAKQLLADTLSPLLVPGKAKGSPGRGIQGFQGTHQSPPGLPRSNHVPQFPIQDAQLSTLNDEVPIDDQVTQTFVSLV